jgi:hypothetical protein
MTYLLTESSTHLLNIEIACLHFSLCSPSQIILKKPELSYKPFIKTPEKDSITVPVTLEFEKVCRTEIFPKVFENEGPWSSVYKDGDAYIITRSASGLDDASWSMRFDRRFDDVRVYHRGKSGGDFAANPLSYPMDQLLLIHVLARHEGALVHSAALDFKGKAYIFAGRSGAGKSTLSRHFQSAGYDVLSDDRIALRKMDNDFWAYGTPWSGEADIALNKGLPLGGLFFISHGPDNIIRAITQAEAAEKLMPVTSIPFYDKEAMLNILSFCEDLVLHIPAYELFFSPGIELVDFIEEFISRQ